jgi:hypothetical protein
MHSSGCLARSRSAPEVPTTPTSAAPGGGERSSSQGLRGIPLLGSFTAAAPTLGGAVPTCIGAKYLLTPGSATLPRVPMPTAAYCTLCSQRTLRRLPRPSASLPFAAPRRARQVAGSMTGWPSNCSGERRYVSAEAPSSMTMRRFSRVASHARTQWLRRRSDAFAVETPRQRRGRRRLVGMQRRGGGLATRQLQRPLRERQTEGRQPSCLRGDAPEDRPRVGLSGDFLGRCLAEVAAHRPRGRGVLRALVLPV